MDKNSSYECGFQPFTYTIERFDVRYYIVGLLFLIFDLEMLFLIPWIMALNFLSILGFMTGLFFFGMLILGFYYEYSKGSLDWD